MTTTVKVHVNGRYRATVKQDNQPPVIVEGAYEGSPNPTGEKNFYLAHPAHSKFEITEEYVPEVPVADQFFVDPSATYHEGTVGDVFNKRGT